MLGSPEFRPGVACVCPMDAILATAPLVLIESRLSPRQRLFAAWDNEITSINRIKQ